MRFTHEQLHTCLDIIRTNDTDGTSFNNSAMCVGYLIEEGLDLPEATELYSAAEVIDEMGLAWT